MPKQGTDDASERPASRQKANKPKALTREEFHSRIRRMRDDARGWIDNEVAPRMETYWRYYNGHCKIKNRVNRSSYVVTEVRDTCEAALVSINRISLTADPPAEFVPQGPDDMDLAEEQTDTSNHVLFRENAGYTLLQDAYRDGIVADIGVLRVDWDESVHTSESEYEGLTPDQFQVLASDPEVEILEMEIDGGDGDQTLADQLQQAGPGDNTISIRLRRTTKNGRVKVDSVPSEEFIIDQWATHPDDESTILTGIDGVRRVQDVVNSGLATWSEIRTAQNSSSTTNMQGVRSARSTYQLAGQQSWADEKSEGTLTTADEAVELIRVSELYIRIDRSRTGRPQLFRAIMLGDTVMDVVAWDRQPFCVGSPFRRPHGVIGYGFGWATVDIQDLSTALMRNALDAVYAAVNPQKLVVTQQANISDVIKNEFDGVIRARAPNMVQPIITPFVGDSAVQMFEHVERMKEFRTGITRASQGLDPDALQSSTEIGVISTFSAAQAKVETVARNLMEGIVAPAFRKIAELLAEHQDAPKIIRMRGEFARVDPRSWVNILDTTPSVGIGRGTQQERQSNLSAIMVKQEQAMMQLGPSNPVTDLPKHVQAINDLAKISGIKEVGRYFNTPQQAEQIAQQMAQAQAQNQQPSPEEMKLQIEQQKIQLEAQKQQQQMQLDAQKQQQDIQLRQAQAQAEIEIEQFKAKAQVEIEQFKARSLMGLKTSELEIEASLDAAKVQSDIANDIKRANADIASTSTNGSTELRTPE